MEGFDNKTGQLYAQVDQWIKRVYFVVRSKKLDNTGIKVASNCFLLFLVCVAKLPTFCPDWLNVFVDSLCDCMTLYQPHKYLVTYSILFLIVVNIAKMPLEWVKGAISLIRCWSVADPLSLGSVLCFAIDCFQQLGKNVIERMESAALAPLKRLLKQAELDGFVIYDGDEFGREDIELLMASLTNSNDISLLFSWGVLQKIFERRDSGSGGISGYMRNHINAITLLLEFFTKTS